MIPAPHIPRPPEHSDIPRVGELRKRAQKLSFATNNSIYVQVQKNMRFIWNPDTHTIDVSPRTDQCPTKFFKAFDKYSIGNHESVGSSMTRVFDMICAGYARNRIQKMNVIEGRDDLSAAKELESVSCVRVKVNAPFFSSIPTSVATDPDTFYLKQLTEFWLLRTGKSASLCDVWFVESRDDYLSCTHPSCIQAREWASCSDYANNRGHPLYYASKAFVSGGTAEGVVEALSRSCRTRTMPTVDPKLFTAAYIHTLSKIPPMQQIPKFSEEEIHAVPKRPGQSAGYMPVKPYFFDYEEAIIKYVNTAKQGEAYEYSFQELKNLVEKVREGINREKQVPTHWYPLFLSKISVKPEIRMAGSNVSKTRIIYITCLIYLMLDTVLFKEYVKNSYQRAGCMIGHQWKNGGAAHLANFLGWGRKDQFYVTMDVKHFDQSALAAIIELIIMMPLMTLKDDGSTEFKMFRNFVTERAHQMACKIAKWEGDEYRLIIGQVFSGLFLTSWLDTIYMILCVTISLTAIYQEIKKLNPERAKRFKYSFIRRLQYGDNSLYTFPMEFLEDICGGRTPECPLGRIQELLSTLVGLELKPEETYLFLPDDSGISPLFTITKPRFENKRIVGYDIVRQGPEFLKRKFVYFNHRGKTHIMPWRCEDDFFTKSCITASFSHFDPDKWSSKFIGLMVDTMGTNEVAYQTLKHMFLSSLQGNSNSTAEEKIKAYFERLPKLNELDDVPSEIESNDAALRKVLARTGLGINEAFSVALNRDKLIDQFVYNEEWRQGWAKSYKLNLYNPDGSIRADANYDRNWHTDMSFVVPSDVQYPDHEWCAAA